MFIDTSALVALVHGDDRYHRDASAFVASLGGIDRFATHNYVAVETVALVQRRHGIEAARRVLRDMVRVLDMRWVTPAIHETAVGAMLAGGKRRASLVDYVSFEVMRREGIDIAFAFDRDFGRVGFRIVPSLGRAGSP